MMSFQQLIQLQGTKSFVYETDHSSVVFSPDLGARVFCELNGLSLHRIDIENIKDPTRDFNNYGGNNFWPAPEGGLFGFNYQGDDWYVQPSINQAPFTLEYQSKLVATAVKETTLTNRQGENLEVVMRRHFSIAEIEDVILNFNPVASLAYTTADTISVTNTIRTKNALLACWSLEQFDATSNTISFVKVAQPEVAINFDFYDDPKNKITYAKQGFFYHTDSLQRGQIGIKKKSQAVYVGFYDLERKILCLRQIVEHPEGLYFNIADNDQPNGPYSAEDNYSIFNGDQEMGFFEIETIGGAEVLDGCLQGSRLVSKTSFALFKTQDAIENFVTEYLK
jgi:hypothetical protein